MKIGQEIIINESTQVKSLVGEQTFNIKEGDRALVTKSGLKFLTGEVKGKTILNEEASKATEYDRYNIAEIVVKAIMREVGQYEFQDLLDETELRVDDIINEVAYKLSDFI